MSGGMTLSEDEVGSVDIATFDKFFLDELCQLSDRYDGIGIHCCATAQHQWDNFKKIPKLRLLNLHVEPERALHHFENFVPQWHPLPDEGTPAERVERITGNAHAVIRMTAESREDAERIVDELWLAAGRN